MWKIGNRPKQRPLLKGFPVQKQLSGHTEATKASVTGPAPS